MKNQALFSLKDKSEKTKCRLLQFLFGALRVKRSPANSFLFYTQTAITKYLCALGFVQLYEYKNDILLTLPLRVD